MTREGTGTLYLVATPIGNLTDISERAKTVLSEVDLIAAEDTRHSRHLLDSLGLSVRMVAYHDHNETNQSQKLVEQLLSGDSIALISDAGTPLINDPGFRLVALAHDNNICVVPVPGACAAIAALSASGLTVNRFAFEGFPSSKKVARIKQFEKLENEERTLVFYVSNHKVLDTLVDMKEVFGEAREVTFARELTKTFETIRKTTLEELCEWVKTDSNQSKGEIVVVVSGIAKQEGAHPLHEEILNELVKELPVKQAATIASRITGDNKNDLYKRALTIKESLK